jgi:hypothetical protein
VTENIKVVDTLADNSKATVTTNKKVYRKDGKIKTVIKKDSGSLRVQITSNRQVQNPPTEAMSKEVEAQIRSQAIAKELIAA